MSDPNPRAPVHIRSLEFDAQARAVKAAGRETLLDARSTQVLSALVETFGHSVSKNALLRAGWPAQLVHENSLAKAISKLRAAIEGSGVEIVANYGVGYTLRDASAVKSAGPNPNAIFLEAKEPARTDARSLLMVGASVFVLLAALGMFLLERPGQTVPFRQSPPITNDPPHAVATVLWVDDHPSNNSLEVEQLRRDRVAVHLAQSTSDALRLLSINRYKLVVSDLGRGEDRLAGLNMVATMNQKQMTVPVIIYTVRPNDHFGEEKLRRLVIDAGAADLAVTPQEVRAKISRRLFRKT